MRALLTVEAIACIGLAPAQVTVTTEAWLSDLLTSGDADYGDNFSAAVVHWNDVLFAGAPYDTNAGAPGDYGVVYGYQRVADSWVQQWKIVPTDTFRIRRFGAALAFDGTTLVVGAPDTEGVHGQGDGAAYVFELQDGDWVQTAKLTPSDLSSGTCFGYSLAVSGNVLVAGGPLWYDSTKWNASAEGHAYIFEKSGTSWLEKAILAGRPALGANEPQFGRRVALSSDRVFVSAPYEGPSEKGLVYVFERAGEDWQKTAELTQSDSDYGRAGWSISADGDTLVVGAPGDYDGTALVFGIDENGDWVQRAALLPDGSAPGGGFGSSVSIRGDRILAGSPDEDVGTAYVFDRLADETWTFLRKLSSADAISNQRFGAATSLDKAFAIVGAPNFSGNAGYYQGAFYSFDVALGTSSERTTASIGQLSAWSDFGGALACDGSTIAVSVNGGSSPLGGQVFIFDQVDGAWTLTNVLAPPVPDMSFGHALAISPTMLVVAATGGGPVALGNGAVYVYEREGTAWLNTGIIGSENGYINEFGTSVGMSADQVVISARGTLTDSGIVLVYSREGGAWIQAQILTPSDAAGSSFGVALTVQNDTLVVGAPNGSLGHGAAYVFSEHDGAWSQEAKLQALDGDAGDSFGAAVAISGDMALIGAPYEDGVVQDEGSVYVFQHSGSVWLQQSKLTPSDAQRSLFGFRVATTGNSAVIGAGYFSGAAGEMQGAVYVFSRAVNAWNEAGRILAPDAVAGDAFGSSVTICGDLVIAGAPEKTVRGDAYAGSAYAFRLVGCRSPGCEYADIAPPADCLVGLDDLALLLANYGQATSVGDTPPFDGIVDLVDLAFLLAKYGSNCN